MGLFFYIVVLHTFYLTKCVPPPQLVMSTDQLSKGPRVRWQPMGENTNNKKKNVKNTHSWLTSAKCQKMCCVHRYWEQRSDRQTTFLQDVCPLIDHQPHRWAHQQHTYNLHSRQAHIHSELHGNRCTYPPVGHAASRQSDEVRFIFHSWND